MNNIVLDGKASIGSDKLTVIGGPCVAESVELCLEIAGRLKEICDKLDVNYVFKASFDKANRSSVNSFRGLGLEPGLEALSAVKEKYSLPLLTDIHEVIQVEAVAKVVDILQIPAFLCRQTDLLVEAAKSGKTVNIKKGQFMAPEDMKGAVEKVRSSGNENVMLTERGTSFGYHNLVVDMRGLATMRSMGVPVVFDATHSVQLPGGLGNASGGQREFIRPLARAAAAVGIDALFMETHPNPEKALSDGPNSLDYESAEIVISEVKEIHGLKRKSS
jgi:2-dehydro-3-deoxyphosphooctonate aldolase (KDO 8-P synthase)